MRPILFQWGDFAVPAWHTMYAIAAVVCFVSIIILRKKYYPEIKERDLASLFVFCYFGGYFGARLLSIFIDQPEITGFFPRLMALFQLGPLTFYGGAIGSFAFGYIYIRRRKISLGKILDLALPSSLIALSIGRIGCFLNGCDYGIAAPLDSNGNPAFWALENPVLHDQIPRYPAQLISSFSAAVLSLLLLLSFGKLKKYFKPGFVGILGIASYALLRFFIEYIRGDDRGWLIQGKISTSQFISILVIFFVAASLPRWQKKSRN